ncbi:hypothetical protein D3C76_106730 [compost metagenome]
MFFKEKLNIFVFILTLTFFVFILTLTLLVSCSNDSQSHRFFETKTKAIDYGLNEENALILKSETYNGENLILIKSRGWGVSLGQVIKKSDEGYYWDKRIPYFSIESDSYVLFDYKLENGEKVPMIIGRSGSPKDRTVMLTGLDGSTVKLDVIKGYFMGFNIPYNTYEVATIP